MLVNWEVCTAKQPAEVFPATSVVDAGQTCNLSAKLVEDTLCMLVNWEMMTSPKWWYNHQVPEKQIKHSNLLRRDLGNSGTHPNHSGNGIGIGIDIGKVDFIHTHMRQLNISPFLSLPQSTKA